MQGRDGDADNNRQHAHHGCDNGLAANHRVYGEGWQDQACEHNINAYKLYRCRRDQREQSEKTDNIMEEFVLYAMLGVFVIFTVDSFTRAGRYVR